MSHRSPRVPSLAHAPSGGLVALALFAFVACSPDAPSPAPAPPPSPAREVIQPDAPDPEPPPLAEPETVRVPTEDGVVLVGDLRVGASPTAPLVVLVHQLSSDRSEWNALLRELGAEPALTTFAFDLRGHGESTQRADGSDVSASDFEPADWQRLPGDVLAAVAAIQAREDVSPARVALVGSSIGGSAVIVAAADEPSVQAVVALSPGRAYRGIDALTPLTRLGDRPLLAIASRGEAPSAETAQNMERIAPQGELLLVEGDRHGVAMWESAPESQERVVAFLREHLSAAPRGESAPREASAPREESTPR